MPVGSAYETRGDENQTVLAILISQLLSRARTSQAEWSVTDLPKRLLLVRKFRELLAAGAQSLCETTARSQKRGPSEILTAEVFPLIAACRFLEREAAPLLAPRRLGKAGVPLWLHGIAAEVHREPCGVVLIIGPANYSISLPGIQLLQAIVSGNAVLFKPGPGGTHSARALLQFLETAGLGSGLVSLLPESIDAARIAIASGVDRVVFTGSATVGAKILADLAPQLVPATMELSGCDAMLVRQDGDLDLVSKSLHFSLNLHSGATCIAPHRLLIAESRADELERRLYTHFRSQPNWRLTDEIANRVLPYLTDALARGARFITGEIASDGSIIAPVILAGITPECRLLRADIFAPLIAALRIKDDEEAIRIINDCPYRLGASIFSANEAIARAIAARLRVGLITVNDVIVPAGDPRIPIGGRGRSGFGTTRGREGLLDLTIPKVVSVQGGRFRPHLNVVTKTDLELLYTYLKLFHVSGVRSRWSALKLLARRFFEPRTIRHRS